MRNVCALTNNISYMELRFVEELLPYLLAVLYKKRRKTTVNIAQLAKEVKLTPLAGNNVVRYLAIAGVITYKARQPIGTEIYIESPTSILQLKEYFESEEAYV